MQSRELLHILKELINQSCDFDEAPSSIWVEFHRDFLKRSLDAMDIRIDYDKKYITSWSAKPVEPDAATIFKLRDSVNPHICYDDLEATLLGCIKNEDFFRQQYQKLIEKYASSDDYDISDSDKKYYLG